MYVACPVCLFEVGSASEWYSLYGASSVHSYPNGSVLGTGDWTHHNLVAASCNSVGDKYEVGIVPSSPPAAIGGAGEYGIVNGVGLRPVLYKFTIGVRDVVFTMVHRRNKHGTAIL